MISSCLINRTHCTKVNERFSESSHIVHAAPQGSILGPLLFNIDLVDLFYQCKESNIASYADDTIQSKCGKVRTRITPNTDTFHAVLAI